MFNISEKENLFEMIGNRWKDENKSRPKNIWDPFYYICTMVISAGYQLPVTRAGCNPGRRSGFRWIENPATEGLKIRPLTDCKSGSRRNNDKHSI
ncbi:MAG: hypothetical protein P8X42_19070 [Calditrichaceae bacterium]